MAHISTLNIQEFVGRSHVAKVPGERGRAVGCVPEGLILGSGT